MAISWISESTQAPQYMDRKKAEPSLTPYGLTNSVDSAIGRLAMSFDHLERTLRRFNEKVGKIEKAQISTEGGEEADCQTESSLLKSFVQPSTKKRRKKL